MDCGGDFLRLPRPAHRCGVNHGLCSRIDIVEGDDTGGNRVHADFGSEGFRQELSVSMITPAFDAQ